MGWGAKKEPDELEALIREAASACGVAVEFYTRFGVTVRTGIGKQDLFLKDARAALEGVGGVARQTAITEWMRGEIDAKARKDAPPFEEVRPFLVPRIEPPQTPERKDRPPGVPFFFGPLSGRIVIWGKRGASPLAPEVARVWGKSAESLFGDAIENLRFNSKQQDLRLLDVPDLPDAKLCVTMDGLAASRALLALELVPPGPFGALLGIPEQDTLLLLPLQTAEAHGVVPMFAWANLGFFRDAKEPLFDMPLWTDGTAMDWFRVSFDATGAATMVPPPAYFANLGVGVGGQAPRAPPRPPR